jgi:hypothetical protein
LLENCKSMDLGAFPQEIKDHIFATAGGGKFDRPSEFFVVLGRTSQSSITKPVSSFSKNEVLVRGYPVGGTLYVTEFVKLNPDKTCCATSPSELFEDSSVNQFGGHLSWRRDTAEFAYGPHTKDEWARSLCTDNPVTFAAFKVSDHLKRLMKNSGSSQMYAPAANENAFYCTWQGDIYTNATREDDQLQVARYSMYDINKLYLKSPNLAHLRREVQHELIMASRMPGYALQRIANARAIRTKTGSTKMLLQLNKSTKFEVGVPIIATLPIMAKMCVPRNRELPRTITDEPELMNRICISREKWFACVPAKLMLKQYQDYLKRKHPGLTEEIAKYDLSIDELIQRAIDTRQRIIPRVADNEGVVTNDHLDDDALLPQNISAGRHVVREEQFFKPILGTAFTQIAVILNFVMCEHGAPYKDMTNPAVLEKLMMWSMRTKIAEKYGLGSPSLRRVEPGMALRSRAGKVVPAAASSSSDTGGEAPAPKRKSRLSMLSGK